MRTGLHVDALGLEARAGAVKLQGHLSGGLQSELFPVRAGLAHLFRISAHQVQYISLDPFRFVSNPMLQSM